MRPGGQATIADDIDTADPYAVLGVAPDADDAVITAAHRRLARRHHPDVAGETATLRMMAINAAYDAIRTAPRRAALDAARSAASGASGGAGTAPGGSTTARERLRWRPPNDGTGKAGPPPGRPSGSVLDFGRHKGWSIGEIARIDPGYLAWLEERREGHPYLDEIDQVLRRIGFRPDPAPAGRGVHGRRDEPRRRGFRRS